jgi:hypothetical protein
MTGDSEMGVVGRGGAGATGPGADSDLVTTGVLGAGVGIDVAFVTDRGVLNAAGAGAGACVGVNVDCAPLNTAPVSRLTSFTVGVFPAKNSLAERVGSEEAAAG